MARYLPPTRVMTRERPWLSIVTSADPDFERLKYHQREMDDGGRPFGNHFHNPQIAGAYNRRSNVYGVGQQYGGLDQSVTDALAPTVGNAVPGLYQGVDDNNGWA